MKTTLLLTTAIAGFFAFRAATADRSAPVAPAAPAKADVAEITRDFLLKFGWRYTAAMLAAQVSLEWFPYLEGLVRTLRVGKSRRALTTRKLA